MSQGSVLKVRLSLKGRPIRSYTFSQKQVSVGRDPDSDIFLDNAGVSRNHAKFELTAGGFVVEDLGSANGTFLNDEQISKKQVADDDIVRVGKFALWLNIGEDQRAKNAAGGKKVSTTADQGTVVLSNDQIDRMLSTIKADEEDALLEPSDSPRGMRDDREARSRGGKLPLAIASSASFLIGVAVGAVLVWLVLTQNPTFLGALQ
jgi:pSer/pThr/pTyr-binding forkhead associated (FHA) protein